MSIAIFIISLKDAVLRRGGLINELTSFGLNFEIFDAIDGRIELPREYEHLIDRNRAILELKRSMTDGEFACALSHIGIYKQIIESQLSGAIIFEDDARLCDDFRNVIEHINFSRVDFLQFHYGNARVWRFGRRVINRGSHVLYRLVHNTGLASAYYLSLKGARYMVENALPISLPADWPCSLDGLRPQIVHPRIAYTPIEVSRLSALAHDRGKAKAQMSIPDSIPERVPFRYRIRGKNPVPAHWRYFSRIFSMDIGR